MLFRSLDHDTHKGRVPQPLRYPTFVSVMIKLISVFVPSASSALVRALSGCWPGHVRWRDEEIEIALSRSPFPSRGHQLRCALVFPLSVELARHPQRTATNQRANASVACAAFATRNAHRNFSRASGRSGNTSRSSGICCALHSIANSSRRDSLPGANSPKSPKIRPTRSEGRFFLPSFRLSLDKLTEPFQVHDY